MDVRSVRPTPCALQIPGIMGFTCNFGKALLRFPCQVRIIMSRVQRVFAIRAKPSQKGACEIFVRRQLSKLLAVLLAHRSWPPCAGRRHRRHAPTISPASSSRQPLACPFLPLAPTAPLPPPLNVRQVIYTRGFTARKILRKAVTRDRNATRGTASSLFFLPRTKNHFFTRQRPWSLSSYQGTSLRERERERRKIVQADCESRR